MGSEWQMQHSLQLNTSFFQGLDLKLCVNKHTDAVVLLANMRWLATESCLKETNLFFFKILSINNRIYTEGSKPSLDLDL